MKSLPLLALLLLSGYISPEPRPAAYEFKWQPPTCNPGRWILVPVP